jgi:hypothetical protein
MKTQLELGNYASGPAPVNYTNPLPVISGGVAQGQIYHGNASITNTPQTITFIVACTTIVFSSKSGSADVYINLKGATATGTSVDFVLFGGSSYTYAGQALPSVSILGASASGTLAICAH